MKKSDISPVSKVLLILIGLLFIIVGITAIVNSIIDNKPFQILWICYTSLIVIGIGILKRKPTLLVTQLNILAIPFLIWGLDFFYILITNKPLWGITNYFFEIGRTLPKLVSLQHLFTLPLSLYVLSVTKINNSKTIIYSVVQLVLIFLISILATPQVENINCVFESCMTIVKTTKLYPFIWFGSSFFKTNKRQ
jgi:hypothetical protein